MLAPRGWPGPSRRSAILRRRVPSARSVAPSDFLHANHFETRTRARSGPERRGKGVLPPGTSSPVTLYRQSETTGLSRAGLIGRVAMWLGIACLVVEPGRPGARISTSTSPLQPWRRRRRRCARPRRQLDIPLPGQPAVALVIGYDARKGEGTVGRSDTLMLVRADPETDSISLLSFPRDMRVEVPCPNWTPDFDKINAAYGRVDHRARCRPSAAYRRTDQLPHHRELPRLSPDRRPAWRRVDLRLPAVLQRSRRADGIRDDQPPARVTSSSRGARRWITSGSGTRTPTSTASRASSSSDAHRRQPHHARQSRHRQEHARRRRPPAAARK